MSIFERVYRSFAHGRKVNIVWLIGREWCPARYFYLNLYTMKQALFAFALLLFASCERCYEFDIVVTETKYNKSNGVYQSESVTRTSKTDCSMTRSEAKQMENDLEESESYTYTSGNSKVVRVVSVSVH